MQKNNHRICLKVIAMLLAVFMIFPSVHIFAYQSDGPVYEEAANSATLAEPLSSSIEGIDSYQKLVDAVDVAADGDVLILTAGFDMPQPINISKSITIQGAGETTILKAADSLRHFTVSSDVHSRCRLGGLD